MDRFCGIVLFGLTVVAGCQLLLLPAMQRMPVAVALLIPYLAPALLVMYAWARTGPSAAVAAAQPTLPPSPAP
ncbi:MAG: hypothetical protein ACK5IN_06900 [Microbacterium sp.]|uniref:hypothetical protein n=1 Tax=Microbacterium sp. TaxID=51671 RepID=UPI003A89FC4D